MAIAKTVLLAKIKKELADFSTAERKIATYILQYPEFIPNMTTKELAEQAKASQASIVRFCKRIGMESFPKFKLSLAQELTYKDYSINSVSLLEQEDSPYMLFQKVSSLNQIALDMGTKTLRIKSFENAIHMLEKAKKVVFFGVGGSYTSCVDGQYKFMRLGYNTIASSDYHYTIPFITMMSKQDVVFCISSSGHTKEVLELAAYVKECGVYLICLTASLNSPLSKMAETTLLLPNVEAEQRIGSIASRTNQLNIIDALYVSVFRRVGEDLLEAYDTSREKTREKRKS